MADIELKLSSSSSESISSYDHMYFTFFMQFHHIYFTFYVQLYHIYFTFYMQLHQICKEREKVESDMIQVKDEWRAKLRDTERLNSSELSVLQKDLNEQVNIFWTDQFLLINIIV